MKITSEQKKFLSQYQNKSKINWYEIKRVYPEIHDTLQDKAQKKKVRPNKLLYILVFGHPKCAGTNCESTNLGFKNFKRGFDKFCSKKCANSSPESNAKREQTFLKNYGVTNPGKCEKIKRQRRKTMVKRYGVEYTAQSPKLRKKMENTCLENYGVTSPMQSSVVRKRCEATSIERYGVASPMSDPSVQAKYKETCRKKYGVEHPFQDREVFEKQQKSGFSLKKITIAGKKYQLRGYESDAVIYLHKNLRVKPEHILTTSKDGLPTIRWTDKKGKGHVYHPDLKVKVKGKWFLVEVKSDYTLGLRSDGSKTMFYVARRKAQACIDAGYRFKLLLVQKGKVSVVSDFHETKRKDLISRYC